MHRANVKFSDEVWRTLRLISKSTGDTVSGVIRDAISLKALFHEVWANGGRILIEQERGGELYQLTPPTPRLMKEQMAMAYVSQFPHQSEVAQDRTNGAAHHDEHDHEHEHHDQDHEHHEHEHDDHGHEDAETQALGTSSVSKVGPDSHPLGPASRDAKH